LYSKSIGDPKFIAGSPTTHPNGSDHAEGGSSLDYDNPDSAEEQGCFKNWS